jgi:hypothetical protein
MELGWFGVGIFAVLVFLLWRMRRGGKCWSFRAMGHY